MDRSAIVIGAGITGVSAAEWLRRGGWRVTLIDRVAPGDAAQTSYGNAGVLARSGIVPVSTPGLLKKAPRMLLDRDSPLFLRWSYLPRLLPWLVPFLRNGSAARMRAIVEALATVASDSVDQHQSLAAGTGAERYLRTGSYTFVYRDRAEYHGDRLAHALRREHGFAMEEVEADRLRELDPALSADYRFAASYPDHGWITAPGRYVAALAEHFAREGGELRLGEVADAAQAEEGATVTLVGGETLSAAKLVLAAGVWSRRFAERLGARIPMEAERGHHLMLSGASAVPPHPLMISAGKFVLTPMEDGLRVAGTAEFGHIDAPISEAALGLLRRGVRRAYPGLTWEREETWLGRRPSTTDSLPVIGASRKARDVIFAFGGQHIGLTIGPRLGRMAAEIAGDRRGNVDLRPFGADRFG